MLHRFLILMLFLLIAPLVIAAHPAAGWKPVTTQELKLTAKDLGDAEADAAILFRDGTLKDDDLEGTNLILYIRIKIFNDRGRRFADIQLPYKKELGKITDVSARTIKPDGTIIEVEDRDIFDKLILKSNSRTERAKVFSLPGVESGSIIEYRYRQIYPQGFRYFALDLQSELFIKQLTYTIQIPFMTNSDVRWVTFNVQDKKRFEPVWDGAFKINVENIQPFRREPMMPPELTVKMWGWLYYSDEFEQKPDKYWREYAKRMYYRSLAETESTKAIRRVIATIINASDNHQEIIAKIYKYVQGEIRNIGSKDKENKDLESDESIDLFKKNASADETIKRRYGTPREINRLFIAMLRVAGFEARVIELVTRDENLFHHSFTDAFQFNGEACVIIGRDGSLQFYDVGTAYCPLGLLAWEKEAVTALMYGDKDGRFVETPVSNAEGNNEDKKLIIKPYADGHVDVQVESKVTGLRALELRQELKGLTRDEQRKHILTSVRQGLPTATIKESSVMISDTIKPPSALDKIYSFTLPQAATSTEKRLFLKPALLTRRDENLLPSSTSRATNLRFHYPWSETERAVVETPAGYEIEQLPDAIDLDIGAARYQATFLLEGGCIIYERKLVINGINFSVKQYPIVKDFFDRVLQSDRIFISFRQK